MVTFPQLPENEVHLWYLVTDAPELDDPSLLGAYQAWLSPEERARKDRYFFEHSRREYLLTRALVRFTLSRYAPVLPAAWRFRANAYGCPAIDLPDYRALRFNLSNTAGLVACVVALDRDVGVDVEDTERSGETVSIADSFFSRPELRALRALPPERRRSAFFDYWTLKEAYIKARGMGLSIPLDQFSFDVSSRPIRIAFDGLDDDAESWQFEQFVLPPGSTRHRTSVAVRRHPGEDVRFKVERTVPLPSSERGSLVP
jgi:4'-phosphopantetheinyl transferase